MAEQWLEESGLYAWMAEDPPGHAGIVATILPGIGSAPAVVTERRIAAMIRPSMERVARISGKKLRLVRFTYAEVLDEVGP